MAYLYLAITITGELVGTTFLKYSEGFTKLTPSVVSVISYLICYISFSKAVQHLHLGVAYATWSAVGLVVTTLIGFFLFKQQLTPVGIAAIAMIASGVIILNLYGTPAGQ